MWNEEALIASKDIILCEALIDAMTFWVAGYRHVTASYGVNGFTDDHRAAFEKHGTERVYIAYDRDEAGDKAAAKLAEELMGMGIECFRVQFPQGHGRQRIRAQDAARDEGAGRALDRRGVDGQRAAASGPRAGSVIAAEPPAAAAPAEAKRRAAKEKIIEEANAEPEPEPGPAPVPDCERASAATSRELFL